MNKVKMIVSCPEFEKEYIIIESAAPDKENLKAHIKYAIKDLASYLEAKTISCNVIYSLESPDFNLEKDVVETFRLIADMFAFLASRSHYYLEKSDYESILFYNLHQLFVDASCEADIALDWIFF